MTGVGPRSFTMRAPCVCGRTDGVLIERNGQDTVRCIGCDRFQYCAPRTETGRAQRSNESVHGGIKPAQRARLIARALARCEHCGATGPGTILHIGHIVSVEAGLRFGVSDEELNDDENLLVMCEACNLGQGAEPMSLRLAVTILRTRVAWVRRGGST